VKKKLLLTGASGVIGSALRHHLNGRYDLRLHFLGDGLVAAPEDEIVISDLADLNSLVEAGSGVDAIVHLGGVAPNRGHTQTHYDQMILKTNITGTYNIFEAARINKVRTVVFASSNGVTGMYEKEGVHTTPEMLARPRDFNGVSKVFGEAMGRHYHDLYNMSVYCIRICDFEDTEEVNRDYMPGTSRWLSPRDMAELTACCLEAPHPQFGIFYGVSRGAEMKWDISNARKLVGWEPLDRGLRKTISP
jgi:nucleoside-diphosphate-sugar epimerase